MEDKTRAGYKILAHDSLTPSAVAGLLTKTDLHDYDDDWNWALLVGDDEFDEPRKEIFTFSPEQLEKSVTKDAGWVWANMGAGGVDLEQALSKLEVELPAELAAVHRARTSQSAAVKVAYAAERMGWLKPIRLGDFLVPRHGADVGFGETPRPTWFGFIRRTSAPGNGNIVAGARSRPPDGPRMWASDRRRPTEARDNGKERQPAQREARQERRVLHAAHGHREGAEALLAPLQGQDRAVQLRRPL